MYAIMDLKMFINIFMGKKCLAEKIFLNKLLILIFVPKVQSKKIDCQCNLFHQFRIIIYVICFICFITFSKQDIVWNKS